MRIQSYLVLLLAAPVFASPAGRAPLIKNRAAVEPELEERGLALVPAARSTTTDLGALQPQPDGLSLFWLALPLLVPISASSILFGVAGLVKTGFDLYKDCKDGFSNDCISDTLDVVMAAAFGVYKFASGISARSGSATMMIDGRPVLATAQLGMGNGDRVLHAHVEPAGSGLKRASRATASVNNGTWAVHGTVTLAGRATHHLLYRTAHADDLGFANDGSYHHYRVQPLSAAPSSSSRREEARDGGIVTDYIWRNMNDAVWDQFHEGANTRTVATTVGGWMENNQAEATCAVPAAVYSSPGGSTRVEGDNGVIAYGWNNQAFGFNGRAGGWVDEC